MLTLLQKICIGLGVTFVVLIGTGLVLYFTLVQKTSTITTTVSETPLPQEPQTQYAIVKGLQLTDVSLGDPITDIQTLEDCAFQCNESDSCIAFTHYTPNATDSTDSTCLLLSEITNGTVIYDSTASYENYTSGLKKDSFEIVETESGNSSFVFLDNLESLSLLDKAGETTTTKEDCATNCESVNNNDDATTSCSILKFSNTKNTCAGASKLNNTSFESTGSYAYGLPVNSFI